MKTRPWQRTIIRDRSSNVIAASGGLGSSKTHGAVLKHFSLCLDNKNSKQSAFVEPRYRLVTSAAIPTWRKVLESMGFKNKIDYRVTRGGSYPILHFLPFDQEIHFLTGSDPEMIIAAEYSHATLDEADENPVETFRNLRSRIRCPNAQVRQMVIVGAPQGINWFAEDFDSETQDGWEQQGHLNWYNPERNFRRLRLVTDDNPHLPEGYVQELMDTYGHSPNLVKAYRYGIFTPLFEGSAYQAFREEEHILKEKRPMNPRKTIYLTFDFNSEPLVWTACQIDRHESIPDRNLYYVIDEADEGHAGLDDALYDFIMKFSPKAGFRDTEIRIYGDRSGYQSHHRHKLNDYDYIASELRQFYTRVYIEASKKVAPETSSVNSVNSLFSHARIKLNPNCRGLVRSFQATRWKQGVRKLDKPAGETWTHRSDSFKYLIYQLEVIDALNSKGRIYGINL